MYNRYLTAAAEDDAPPLRQPSASQPKEEPVDAAAAFAGLNHCLSGRLQNLKLDTDTIILLAIIWFLLSDENGFDKDLLLIIGVFLLLGL